LNEVAFVPVMVVPPAEIVTVEVPVFFSVAICATVVDPTAVLANDIVAGVSVTVAVPAVPVPVRLICCGEPVALSATFSVAVRLPALAGLKSTEIVQLALAASVAPHVVAVSANELAFVPVMEIPPVVIVTVDVPVFVSVAICAAVVDPTAVLANDSVAGASVTVDVVAVPVPVRLICCGEPVALSATFSVAVRLPVVVGWKSTEIVQLARAANVVPQVVAV
jgi:hypothetical protein